MKALLGLLFSLVSSVCAAVTLTLTLPVTTQQPDQCLDTPSGQVCNWPYFLARAEVRGLVNPSMSNPYFIGVFELAPSTLASPITATFLGYAFGDPINWDITNDAVWPAGIALGAGRHTLIAILYADDGEPLRMPGVVPANIQGTCDGILCETAGTAIIASNVVTFTNAFPPPPPPPTPPPSTSPAGTTVPPAAEIIDNVGAVWEIGTAPVGQVLRNGNNLGTAGFYAIRLLWTGIRVEAQNKDTGNWWYWSGSRWLWTGR